jgi:hypothetical protein
MSTMQTHRSSRAFQDRVLARGPLLALTLLVAACVPRDPEASASAAADAANDPAPEPALARVPSSTPQAQEPPGVVRELSFDDWRVRIELPSESTARHDDVNAIVTFELGWKKALQLRWKPGPAPERIALAQSDAKVLDEGRTESGIRYSVQTLDVRVGSSSGGRHVHRIEQVTRVYATLPVDAHHHVECTGYLERGVDGTEDDDVQALSRSCLSMVLAPTDDGDASPETTLADPALGTPDVTVVATLVGLPKRFPPHCGRAYFSILAEYEVVRVLSGTLSGNRFFVAHGCPEMLRVHLKSLVVGDVHRLELGTDPRLRGGMSLPPGPRPPFYWVRRVNRE